ncbi:hypothetical protein SAMN05421743_104221 [Thalassobacillus cyri]|uniref:Uncharacterized protein n=1 Tax=Thalassobacillus cyri TaxID=571932 RepID=A0A1H4AW85_9BACI|nr:hypothetical protein SAMN05421743_104221 [Thalassobacillus cyri]
MPSGFVFVQSLFFLTALNVRVAFVCFTVLIRYFAVVYSL